jgi:hypothetical protein
VCRRLGGAVGLMLVGCLVFGLASVSEAEKRGREPKVICVTKYQPPRGIYAYKPGTCEFHKRGVFPIAGYNTARASNINWKAWGNRRARGKGKLGISTVGPVPVKIKLTKPRDRCGKTVFTKGHFNYDGESFDGTPVHGNFDMPLENCLT